MLIHLIGQESHGESESIIVLENIRLINYSNGQMFFDTGDLNGVYYSVKGYEQYKKALNIIKVNASENAKVCTIIFSLI